MVTSLVPLITGSFRLVDAVVDTVVVAVPLRVGELVRLLALESGINSLWALKADM